MRYAHPYRGPRSLSSRATISRDLLPPRAHKGEDLTTGLEGLIPFYPAARRAFPLGNSLEPAIGCPSDNTSVLSDVATSARCPPSPVRARVPAPKARVYRVSRISTLLRAYVHLADGAMRTRRSMIPHRCMETAVSLGCIANSDI